MNDKLDEVDVMNLEMIEVATKALKRFRIKPVYANGVGYYVWLKDDSGGCIPIGGEEAEDVLEAVAYWGVR